MGDRERSLTRAIERLGAAFEITAVSPWYETAPVGGIDQPDFLNLVVQARTPLTPRGVLDATLEVERALGRRRDGPRNGPRTIDIDLLLYGRSIVDQPGLQVPHPRLHQRAFVLAPLSDIAPTLIHPTLALPIRDLLAALPADARRGVLPYRPNHIGDFA